MTPEAREANEEAWRREVVALLNVIAEQLRELNKTADAIWRDD